MSHLTSVLTITLTLAFAAGAVRGGESNAMRAPTVADAIEMTILSGDEATPQGQTPIDPRDVSVFSPDGSKFIVVTKKGNLERNTNDSSLLLWDTQQVLQHKGGLVPRKLLTLSSSSNESAIANVRWRPDGGALIFLAQPEGAKRQVYSLDLGSGTLIKKTNSATNVLDFGLSADGKTLAYVVEQPEALLLDENVRRHGLIVAPGDSIADIVRGRWEPDAASGFGNQRSLLYVSDAAGTRRIATTDYVPAWGPTPLLSPDGRFIVIYTFVAQPPESWREYEDPEIHDAAAANAPNRLYRFALIDVATGHSHPLLDSPFIVNFPSVAWASDSRSVVLAGVYLPLHSAPPADLRERRRRTYVVDVTIPGCQILPIAAEDPAVDTTVASMNGNWLRRSAWLGENRFYVTTARWTDYAKTVMTSVYAREGANWRVVSHHLVGPRNKVIVKVDFRSPPKLYMEEANSGRTTFLLDLNPQFDAVKFCDVKEITWRGRDGEPLRGGLYYPCDYVPGRRYPLVIQTHGWYPVEFGIAGPTHTAFAAQPLAAAGFFVLQADESFEDFDTLKEVDREVSRFETAVEFLDSQALIDRSRVGLIGFSRTGDFVAWAIVHSKTSFAAATIEDGYSLGLPQFFMSNSSVGAVAARNRNIFGGPPFADSLNAWVTRSPTLNLDKVRTPLRVVAIGPSSLIGQIELYTGLNALHEPVEMVYLPEGTHDLQKPWERMVSLQGNLDWYRFWLQDYEDSDPDKIEQYHRWRHLRELRDANRAKTGTQSVH